MTDFLQRLEADLHDAAERRGLPRRRDPRRVWKVVGGLAAVALLVLGAARLVTTASSERAAGEQTPTPTPWGHPPREHEIAAVTAGDPAFLDMLAGPLGAQMGPPIPTGDRPGTAPASFPTMVLYRPDAHEAAQQVGFYAKIDRIEPLTPERERLIDADLSAADVVVVFGADAQARLLEDPDVCAPAGSLEGGPLTLCVMRSDETRISRLVVNRHALPVAAMPAPGWWSWAAASPDGRTILAEWTHYPSYLAATKRCRVPVPAFIPQGGGPPRPLPIGAAVPLGWTTDGRAIAFRPATPGCGADAEPGLYLVSTGGAATLLARSDREAPPPGLEPSIEPRTVEEVTRAAAP